MGISAAIGNTPHIVLGGSVKDRAACGIVDDAQVRGALVPGGTIVEGSTVMTILCDGGSRYGSRLWNRAWLEENDRVPAATDLSFL